MIKDFIKSIRKTNYPSTQTFFAGISLASVFLLIFSSDLRAQDNSNHAPKTIVWKIDNLHQIDGHKPTVIGAPLIIEDSNEKSVSFNGINDGLVFSKIPLEGWDQFTIEVLFKPDGNGPGAPRFIHFQDKEANRGTLEVRLTPERMWYLDTFLKNGKTNAGLTLIDSSLLHPANQWYWVALSYDGKKMASYVNGIKELEGDINFAPLTQGEISVGVRLNKVSWFKGLIREIRFHPKALNSSMLQKNGKTNPG